MYIIIFLYYFMNAWAQDILIATDTFRSLRYLINDDELITRKIHLIPIKFKIKPYIKRKKDLFSITSYDQILYLLRIKMIIRTLIVNFLRHQTSYHT